MVDGFVMGWPRPWGLLGKWWRLRRRSRRDGGGGGSRVVTITRSGVLVGNRAILKGGVWRRM